MDSNPRSFRWIFWENVEMLEHGFYPSEKLQFLGFVESFYELKQIFRTHKIFFRE